MGILKEAGFVCYEPRGAYYIMTDIAAFGFPDDVAFARHLVTEIGVGAVPGSSFYREPMSGRTKLRFCFCKKDETLSEAEKRLARLRKPALQGRQAGRG
jgi:aminotransferase